MKYCLRSNQRFNYLQKADEIKVPYDDRASIFKLIERYPGKTIILEIPNRIDITDIDWTEMNNNKILTQDNFICCVSSYEMGIECGNQDIKFYYGYPINSFYELQAAANLGVCYVRLAPPLLMSLDKVKKFNIPVRAVPNVAYQQYLPFGDGVCGGWIRPEDTKLYEEYIDVYEFEDCDINKEQALYRIYAEKQAWPGQMGMLFTNFNYGTVLNRMVPSDLAEKRIKCGQRCQTNNGCHLCYRALDLANPEIFKSLKYENNELNTDVLAEAFDYI